MDEMTSRFGPGHPDVTRAIEQARGLTESQAFAVRTDRDNRVSPTWLGIHAYAAWELASAAPNVRSWIDAAEDAAEAAVWQAADAWGDEPLAVRAAQSLRGMAARDAAVASAFAARRAVQAAVTAHLLDGRGDVLTLDDHATLAAAWRAVFPDSGEASAE